MAKLTTVANAVKRIVEIEKTATERKDGWAKRLTDGCNNFARAQRKKCGVITDKKTGELTSKPKISYRYYCKLMENYRNAIKALGYKHHLIEKHVNAFISKYSGSIEGLSEMLDTSLPIEKLRDNLIILRSKSVKGSPYKKDLLGLMIEHHSYYTLEPRGAVSDWKRDDDSKSLAKKLKSQILVNPEWVKSTATRLLTSKDPTASDLFIGIALSTGRRLTEIMKTATFKLSGDETLLFSGQLKTENRHLFEKVKPYKIPSLIKAETVINALKLLRKKTGDDTLSYRDVLGNKIEGTVKGGDVKDYYHNRAITTRYESTINIAVRSLMQNGKFSSKDCRAMYTEVTYLEHAGAGESRSAYRHRVLGHSLFETQLHYDSFKIDSDVESVKLFEPKEESTDHQQVVRDALVEYLAVHDDAMNSYIRAPKLAKVHQWLKNEVAGGLLHEQIKSSYIRRHCLFDGKQLNLNIVKGYLGEEFGAKSTYKYAGPVVNISQFVPPKDEPKKLNKKEREILELQERIEEIEFRTEEISTERTELSDEKIEAENRIEEIAEEDYELESEEELIEGELEESQEKLEELLAEQLLAEQEKAKKEVEKASKKEALKEVPGEQWPDADDLDIKTVKKGKMWEVSASANGKYFQILIQERKNIAIKHFKDHYKSETSLNETKKS